MRLSRQFFKPVFFFKKRFRAHKNTHKQTINKTKLSSTKQLRQQFFARTKSTKTQNKRLSPSLKFVRAKSFSKKKIVLIITMLLSIWWVVKSLKLVSAIFYQNLIFHQMIALPKLWKMFFILSKKLFSFLRYSNFCIFVFPFFFRVSHFFRGWFKKSLKVYDVIDYLNKNWITHVWYLEKEMRCHIETLSIDRVLNTEHSYGKIMQKMCTKS